jgi:hypothetical protein
MRLGDLLELGTIKDLAVGERAPALNLDTERTAGGDQRPLGEQRVQLNLIDTGHDTGRGDEPLQVRRVKVRDTDRSSESALAQLEQALPGLDIPAQGRLRPVDQVEIDVVQPQALEALLERADRAVMAVGVVGALARDVDRPRGSPEHRSASPTPGSLR